MLIDKKVRLITIKICVLSNLAQNTWTLCLNSRYIKIMPMLVPYNKFYYYTYKKLVKTIYYQQKLKPLYITRCLFQFHKIITAAAYDSRHSLTYAPSRPTRYL